MLRLTPFAVPLTVIEYVAAGVFAETATFSVDIADLFPARVTEAGVIEHEIPFPDGTWQVRLTIPLNPPIGATVMVDVPELPGASMMALGLALRP